VGVVKRETVSGPETDPDPEIPALWDDIGGLLEDALVRVERGKAFSGMLRRLIYELRQTYGTEDARRIILQIIRESIPSDEVARETQLAVEGYTMSVQKTVVLGCFAGTYFMRSKQGVFATFPIDRTPPGRLEREWRKFRSSALGS
jgi:hypothetical protein